MNAFCLENINHTKQDYVFLGEHVMNAFCVENLKTLIT